MKVTIEPETEEEKATTKMLSFSGLVSLAVIGIWYEGDAIRQRRTHSYNDVFDIMKELPELYFHLAREGERRLQALETLPEQ